MTSKERVARQVIRGMAFPCSGNFTPENITSALDYQPSGTDIIISTYPKSGTTWVQYIVFEILNNGIPPPTMAEMRKIMPYMESSGSSAAEALSPPRAIKYHLPYYMLPKHPNAKYISVIRNPSDVLISYYYFLKQITSVNLDFNDFFEEFVEGDCVYGDYFEHILSWYEHKNDKNVLLLSYEKMRADPRKGLCLVADFIGHSLNNNEELISKILKHTSFEYMKANVQSLKKGDESILGKISTSDEKDNVDFFRKGAVGDGKIHLSRTQQTRLEKRMEEKLRGTDIAKLWCTISNN